MRLHLIFFSFTINIMKSDKSGSMTISETQIMIGATLVLAIFIFISLFGYFQGQQKINTDKIRKTDLASIKSALELYYRDNQHYPEIGSNNGFINMQGETSFCHPIGCGTNSYLKSIPKDPSMDCRYVYKHITDPAEGYILFATIENPKDKGDNVNQAGFESDCGKGCVCKFKLTN